MQELTPGVYAYLRAIGGKKINQFCVGTAHQQKVGYNNSCFAGRTLLHIECMGFGSFFWWAMPTLLFASANDIYS